MSRALLILANDEIRAKAARWVKAAPVGTRVEFKQAKRSTEQNARDLGDAYRRSVETSSLASPSTTALTIGRTFSCTP